MPLDPQLQAARDRNERDAVRPLYTMSLAEARTADLASIQAAGGEPEPVYEVTNLTIPGPGGKLALRLYRPAAERPLPALLYFFGGGWVLGTIDTADGVARSLANSCGALVVVPGYRLAPEHPFPAAIDDCYAALRWVAEHAGEIGADPARLAVGGDSAGGNLAAAAALRARSDGPALAGQLLVYPNTDQLADDQSMRDADDPFLFNHHSVAWYRRHYLTDPGTAANPMASPLRADHLAGLPPALVITAEYDPLRDQGEAYARRLSDEGVPVELSRYPGMVHGFFTMTGTVDASRAAIAQAASSVRAWFGTAGAPGSWPESAMSHVPDRFEQDRQDRMVVSFTGAGAGTAPLGWGLKAIWQDMQESGNQFTMWGRRELPQGSTVADAATRLSGLMQRHAALRTRLTTGTGGRLDQEVAGSGQIGLEVLKISDDTDPAEVERYADDLMTAWHLMRFDFHRDWPLRMAVVRHRGAAVHLVWALSHLVADGAAHLLLVRDLVSPGTASDPERPQILDVARSEQTPQLRRLSSRAMRYWETQLRHIPALTFGEPSYPLGQGEQRYGQARFSSPAAHLAMLAIAKRTGTDASRVALAVIATAIGRATGVQPLTVKVMVNNRFRPGLADVIAPIAQNSVVTIDCTDTTIDDVVIRTRGASLTAGMRAYYDPDELEEVMARLDAERGYPARVTCRVNDQRAMVKRDDAASTAAADDVDPMTIRQKLAETTLSWLGPRYNMHEQVNILIENKRDVVSLHMMWDRQCLTREQVEALLRGVEEIAVEAAFDPAAPTRVSAATLA